MVKIGKKNGKTYAVFEGDCDIFKVEDGLYLVVDREKLKGKVLSKLSKKSKEEKQDTGSSERELNEKEIRLLIKISLIRFLDREWQKVMNMLSKGEQIILKSLIKRGFVKILRKKGKQYISFSEEMYEKLKEETRKRINKKERKVVNINNEFFIIPREHIQNYTKEIDLGNYSYVVDSEGTLFIADKKKSRNLSKKIISALRKGKASHVEIARKANIKEEIALILLKILNEEGVIFEPEKGIYELVEDV